MGDIPDAYPFDQIPVLGLGFERFSRSSEVLFSYFFFHPRPISSSTCNFPFLRAF